MIKYRQDWKLLAKVFTIKQTSNNTYSIDRAGLNMKKKLKFENTNTIELQKWINEWMELYMDTETGYNKPGTPNLINYIYIKYDKKNSLK